MSLENLLEINECIICLDPINNENKINIFECNHYNSYHKKCANDWIKECINKNIKPTCPVCRKKIIEIDIRYTIRYDEQTINYRSLKIFVFFTSIFIVTIVINYY